MKKIFLDARDMEHPLPLQRAIEALKELDDEKYFYMLHRKKPTPLIELAKGQGFQVIEKEDSHGIWHILIATNSSLNLSEYLDV